MHLFYITFYRLIYCLVLPFLICRLLWRALSNKQHVAHLGQRFGRQQKPNNSYSAPIYWVHAVSMGETRAASHLIRQLITQHQCRVLLTNTTLSGSQTSQRLFLEEILAGLVILSYVPYDLNIFIRPFIAHWRPKLVLIMETEIWPMLINYCHSQAIPSILVNARLSEKSLNRYQIFATFFTKIFSRIQFIIAQYSQDHQRFIQLGVAPKNIIHSGNLKLDQSLSPALITQAQQLKQTWLKQKPETLLWVCASIHPQETTTLINSYNVAASRTETPLMAVLVPRHPENFDQIEQTCLRRGLATQRLSDKQPIALETQIIIGDTLGELPLYLGTADVVFMGGTLINHGGQNFVEAALWQVPILSGRSVYNFQHIANSLEQAGGLVICDSQCHLSKVLTQLLLDKKYRHQSGIAAKQVIDKNRGALEKVMKTLESFK